MEKIYDVIVVGGGPAGLTAAIYLARAKYSVLVLEKSQLGGQIAITDAIVNYPGVERISGKELTDVMCRQLESFGGETKSAEVTDFEASGEIKLLHSDIGELRCYGILIATGAQPRSAGFRGEEEFRGRGVGYCATCDGAFFTNKEVFVIGGGYAAAEESVYLTKFAKHVTILIREEDFTCAASVADEARSNEKITVHTSTVMTEVAGSFGIELVRYQNTKTGELTEHRAAEQDTVGVFVFAGYVPDTKFLEGRIDLDSRGYIITDATKKTNTEGVYAAGDVCIKPLRQVVTATSDGALAATELEKYVSALKNKSNERYQKQK